MRNQFRIFGVVSLVVLIVFLGNANAYIIEGELASAYFSWEASGAYYVGYGWSNIDLRGHDMEHVGFFHVISEYGNTGNIPVSYYLTGNGTLTYDITGKNCVAEILYIVNVGDYYIVDPQPPYGQVNEVEIGHEYVSRAWAYDVSDPFLVSLTIFNPYQDASFYQQGYEVVQFHLVLPEEKPPVPEPATMLLLGSGLIGLAWFRKKQKR